MTISKELKECEIKISNVYKFIQSNLDIVAVVLITRGSYIDKHKFFLDNIKKTFDYFTHNNIRLYYIMDNPELDFTPESCVRPFGIDISDCKVDIKSYVKETSKYRDFIFEISKKYPGIKVLDPKNLFCDDKFCYAIRNGKMMYADDDHHSVNGSFEQAKFFEKDFEDVKQ